MTRPVWERLRTEGPRAPLILAAAAGLSTALWPAPTVLVDYPNHLARAHILAHLGDTPALAEHYAVDAQPSSPKLRLDAVLVPLTRLFGSDIAAALGVTLVLVALTGATLLLDRVLNGRVRWGSAAVLLVLFNALLAWGNINYLLGLAGVLSVLSGWIATESWPVFRRLAVFALASTLLFLLHVVAAGVWAMLVAAYELGRLARDRNAWTGLLPGALQFLPAAVLWVVAPHSMYLYEVSGTRWGTLAEHLLALASPFSFDVWLGRFGSPTALADWLTTLVVLGGLAWGAVSRRLVIDRRLWAPLLLGLAFTLTVPVFLNGLWPSHLRLPTLMACLLAAGSTVRWPAPRLAGAVLVGLLALRLATLVPQMTACGASVAELHDAFALMPQGARVLPVLDGRRNDALCKPWQSFSHIASLAVIDRNAFVPIVFWENTLLDLRDPVWKTTGDKRTVSPDQLRSGASAAVNPAEYWTGWPGRFDHVLWLHLGGAVDPLPDGLNALYQGRAFTLYRASVK